MSTAILALFSVAQVPASDAWTFDVNTWFALAPLIALTSGALLALLFDVLPPLVKLRPVAFFGGIAAAAGFQLALLAGDTVPGLVLEGSYLADRVTASWGLIFLTSLVLAQLFGARYYREERPYVPEHDILMLCSVIGMTIVAGAQDLLTFFIGLELLSVPLYALASFRRVRNASVEAGLKYFVLGAFMAGVFLFGTALVYVGTGTFALAELRALTEHSPIVLMGLGLVLASLFFKLSAFPFHLWTPDVYQGSPTPVTALMATGTKAAAFAFLLNAAGVLPRSAAATVAVVALATMAIGNLGALVQSDLKRLLAYSGIAHAGTLLLVVAGLLASDPARFLELESGAYQAALYYMAAYVFTAGGAFGLIALLEADGERFTNLDSRRGLARRRPGIAAAMTLFMLSLGGIPATGGFLGKWFVFSVALQAELYVVAAIGVLLSVVALAYYLRVIVAMYMQPATEGQAPPVTNRFGASIGLAVCSAMVLLLGLAPGLFLGTVL